MKVGSLLKAEDRDGIRGDSRPMESFCLLGSAEGLRWYLLSGIEKPPYVLPRIQKAGPE